MRTCPRTWGAISIVPRRSPERRGTRPWRPLRHGPAAWCRSREARVSSESQRLNRERFSQTAEQFAASQAVRDLSQVDALLQLTTLSEGDRLLDVACGPGRLLATVAPQVRLAGGGART